jgi:glycosyltransferase involved in cell wall biosynthesis
MIMNILHLSCVAPPQTGGIGQVANEIVKRLRDRHLDATLVSPKLKRDLGELDPVWVERFPAFIRWGNAAALGGIEKRMKSADVIHLHYPFFGTAEKVAQYCLWHKKPLVMTFHMDATARPPLGIAFSIYRLFAQPAVLRACKKIFVSSNDYADASSVSGFKKANPDRFIELPFGVDKSFTPGDKTLSKFGIPNDARVIGFVGAMDHAHRFKGIEQLLETVRNLPKDVHLLLVSDGNRRRIYVAKAQDLGIANRCHFVGRLSNEDLLDAYRTMDVFAFPSTSGAEAFGLVAAEAAACGIPAVASYLPGVRTVVKDLETGLLVPPKDVAALRDALEKLLEDKELRKKYGKAAREYASERFDWDVHVDTLIGVYNELCASQS